MQPVNPLSGNAPYFIILLWLTPDDFTRQGESAATKWVNNYYNERDLHVRITVYFDNELESHMFEYPSTFCSCRTVKADEQLYIMRLKLTILL